MLRGAFGSGSPAGSARLVTGSTFPGARPARLRGSRRSRQLGAGRGAGLRRWLLLSGSGPGAGEPPGQRCGPGRPTVTRTGGPSHPTASGPGARGSGSGPAESGLITYSVLQVLGPALATPLAAQGGAPLVTSFSSLPQGSRRLEVGHLPPDRLRLVPAGPDSRSRFSIRLPRPRARKGRAQLGTPSLPRLGPVWTRLGDAAGDSEPG